jgi:hypothetical protein
MSCRNWWCDIASPLIRGLRRVCRRDLGQVFVLRVRLDEAGHKRAVVCEDLVLTSQIIKHTPDKAAADA